MVGDSMIKNIRLFVNKNDKSIKFARLVRNKLTARDFKVIEDDNDDFSLGIAIGGDGSFLRMVRRNSFNSDLYYVGINTGHLGFLQDVKIDEVDEFIDDLMVENYKVDHIGIQETDIVCKDKESKYFSLNEVVIKDINSKLFKADVYIEDDLLENYVGDGIMLATSIGSTAHNLSYNGSIVYPSFSSLQITPMAPISSNRYRPLTKSVIIPEEVSVDLIPDNDDLVVTFDGEDILFNDVDSISSKIGKQKIKVLRFDRYGFAKKINEKLL